MSCAAVLWVLMPGVIPFHRMDGTMCILALFLDCAGTVELIKTTRGLKFFYIKWHFNENLNVLHAVAECSLEYACSLSALAVLWHS